MFLTGEDPIAVVRSLALQRAARVVVVAPSAELGAAVAPTTNRRSVASAAVSSRARCDARERSDATARSKSGTSLGGEPSMAESTIGGYNPIGSDTTGPEGPRRSPPATGPSARVVSHRMQVPLRRSPGRMGAVDASASGRGGSMDTVETLRSRVTGTVTEPGDRDYEESRAVWNAMIDRRPAAVVRAAEVADIAPTIAVAREYSLELAIRAGGHNVAGNGTVEGGIVLDLGGLTGVEVDRDTRRVRVGPGATLGDLDRATEPYGLAVPVGVVSATGVAGLTLGGGVGWLTRPYGLTVDSLLAVDLFTASGDAVHADATENRDLFWGVRGGGGNFGVVTSFTFQAHELGPDV